MFLLYLNLSQYIKALLDGITTNKFVCVRTYFLTIAFFPTSVSIVDQVEMYFYAHNKNIPYFYYTKERI